MQEKANKPALRFKGFDEDWEQRKLGNIAEIVGGGTPNTNISAYWDGDINWYSPAEINEQIYVNSSQRKISEQGYNNSSARMLPVGTVLFTSRAGIGKTAILSHEGCTNQGFQSIVPNPNLLDSYFIFSRTRELKQYGETIGAGSTFVEVSGKQMANMNLMMPSTIQEQKAIGNYFAQLDQLITLHQRKYTKLVNIKKAMLEKMFPKNGEDVPEIRFAGFTDPWEQRKFGDLYERVTEKNDLTYGIDKSITVASMQYKKDGCITNEDYLRTYTICLLGDIVFEGHQSKQFRFGRFVENDLGNGIVSHIFMVFRPKTDYDLYFWKYAINNEQLMRKILSHCTKASRMMNDLVIQDFFKESMPVPTINEQQMIGHFFYKLDQLITLHQRKLEKLQHIKKACLEKMFV